MNIILGTIFLLAGRKIFWLFIASLGFLFGFLFLGTTFLGQADWKAFIIPLIFGLLGLVFALFLQKLAIVFSGFIAGGYIFLSLCNMFGREIGQWRWIFFIASGIAASCLFMILFNPALIVFSSFIGAMLIVQQLPFISVTKSILFTALFIFGILAQSNQFKPGCNSGKGAKRPTGLQKTKHTVCGA